MGNGIFTRNYDNILTLLQLGTYNGASINIGSSFQDGDLTIKAIDGSIQSNIGLGSRGYSYNWATPLKYLVAPHSSTAYGTALYLGENNTEETYEDTAILSPLYVSSTGSTSYDLQYLTPEDISQEYDVELKCFKSTIKYPFIAQRNCIIGEMGFYWYNWYFNQNKEVLVYRKAFEVPYELKVGDTFNLTFTMIVPAQVNKPISIQTEEELV